MLVPGSVGEATELVISGYDTRSRRGSPGHSRTLGPSSAGSRLPEDQENVDFIFIECIRDLGIGMPSNRARGRGLVWTGAPLRHGHVEPAREAWEIEEIVRAAVADMDAALEAIRFGRYATPSVSPPRRRSCAVRDAIDDAAPP